MTKKKRSQFSLNYFITKIFPYFALSVLIFGVAFVGSKDKQQSDDNSSPNLESISKKDYAVSADQLSEFYMVSELANTMSLASSDVLNVNYNSFTVLQQSGQASVEKMEKPTTLNLAACAKVGVIKHVMTEGETLDTLAAKYASCGVDINMIRWSNKFKASYVPKVGESIYIPSRAGIVYTVKSGETVASIAEKYKSSADEIITSNNLELDQTLTEGQVILLPNGELPDKERPDYVAPVVRSTSSYSGRSSYSVASYRTYSTSRNPMPWGWCTWYTWERRAAMGSSHILPGGLGNANTWGYALSGLFPTSRGTNPQAGDIFQTNSGYYGHVGIVDSVNADGTITISDMNGRAGWGVVGSYTIGPGEYAKYLFIHGR
jgi:N-acetylmuramoyl-L-alanine amidase sle1